MINIDKYTGHTPADQWTIYKMGADKPYHAVRFGQRGLDLELEFGADAQLIADAPLILDTYKRLCRVYVKLGEENKKQLDVLSTLDEMIRNEESHVEMMKALEQGLDLPETWMEMIE